MKGNRLLIILFSSFSIKKFVLPCIFVFYRHLACSSGKIKNHAPQSSSLSTVDSLSDLSDNVYFQIDSLSKELFEKMTQDETFKCLVIDVMKFYSTVDDSNKPSCLMISDIDYLSKVSIKEKARYLRHRKKKEVASEMKKLRRAKELSKSTEEIKKTGLLFDESETLVYGFNNNTLICSHNVTKRMKHFFDQKLLYGFLFGQKVVIDFSYDQYMTIKQHLIMNNQVKGVIGLLRNQNDPFSLHFCNFNTNNFSAQYLIKELGSPDRYAINFTSKSYLDMFPKDKLCYLTPHTKERLEYNPDDIYIIGAMIDVGGNIPYSSKKAAQDGIRMASLPIDENFLWKQGNKCLTINQVFGILADLSEKNGTMNDILRRHVPSRKIHCLEEQNIIISRKQKKYEERKKNIVNKFNLSEDETQSLPAI